VIDDLVASKRSEIYAGLLHRFKAWQSQFRFGAFRRFGFMWDWEAHHLKKIVEAFREAQKRKEATSEPN
jgi:hypothetical protein